MQLSYNEKPNNGYKLNRVYHRTQICMWPLLKPPMKNWKSMKIAIEIEYAYFLYHLGGSVV